jgi:XRE family transcriptional regulator, regulator of sulfur utilization
MTVDPVESVRRPIDQEAASSDPEGARVREAVAANMRRARLVRGMSLRDLSAGTGLSTALLSQIERATANPTIAALTRIARAVDLTFAELIRAEVTQPHVVRADPTIPGVARARMLFSMMERRRFEVHEGELPAHQEGVSSEHGRGSVEYGYVVSGAVTATVDGRTYVLEAGDAIEFSGSMSHSYSTDSRPARVLTVVAYSDE